MTDPFPQLQCLLSLFLLSFFYFPISLMPIPRVTGRGDFTCRVWSELFGADFLRISNDYFSLCYFFLTEGYSRPLVRPRLRSPGSSLLPFNPADHDSERNPELPFAALKSSCTETPPFHSIVQPYLTTPTRGYRNWHPNPTSSWVRGIHLIYFVMP